jgi:hypothetical protein
MRVAGRRAFFTAAVVGAFVCVAAAGADNYQFRHTAADQALAARIALKKADFPSLRYWQGGTVKPDESPDNSRCSHYQLPKQSDLVVSGHAETKYTLRGNTIDSEVEVFASAAMVETDWRRSAPRPGFLACIREILAKGLPASERLVSVSKLPFPVVGDHILPLRVLLDVTPSGQKTVRLLFDIISFSRGRTEVALTVIGPDLSANDPVLLRAADVRLARVLNAKIPAG